MRTIQLESVVPPPLVECGFIPESCDATLGCVILVLGEAASCADRNSRDRWDLAVGVRRLLELGVSENDLRYLVQMRVLAHAQEVRITGSDCRTFLIARDLRLSNQSCFVLTESGVELAKRLYALQDGFQVGYRVLRRTNDLGRSKAARTPTWDGDRRVLSLAGVIVKRFARPAENQQAILAAFQEESWPAKIDDPLTPVEEMDSKRRLNDAIKSLNHHQSHHLILFRGDGTGQGITWKASAQ